MTPYLRDPDVTLYCGDALEVLRELPDGSVDACVTDPPYGVTSLGWDVPVADWLPLVDRVLKPSGSVWVFGSLRSLAPLVADAERGVLEPWHYAQEIVWEKHNGSNFHADRFRRVHEFAVQFYRGAWSDVYRAVPVTMTAKQRTIRRRKRRPPHMGDIHEGAYSSEDGGPLLMRSVIQVRSCHGHALHETQKPEGILRPLIAASCPPGGVVLDPFAGVGSTGVAAKQVARGFVGIELSPDYCALAADRLAQQSLFAEGAA